MKLIIKLIIFTFLFNACGSQKTVPEKPISNKTMEEYKAKGYTLGKLRTKKVGDCSYVIRVDGSDLEYDPVNIDDEKFSYLTSKKTSFFFKFLPLRRQNRCDNVSPIQLTEVVDTP